MFNDTKAFSGFSVNDVSACMQFYREVLGLDVEEQYPGFVIKTAGNNPILAYGKDDHQPATFTILNFPVDDIDKAVDELTAKGVVFEHYDGVDEKGILRGRAQNMGPDIAWFKDPAGNVLSVLQS